MSLEIRPQSDRHGILRLRRVARHDAVQLKDRGVADERVRIVFGGYDEKLKVQLWVQPKGAPPPVEDAGAERKLSEAAQVGRMDFFQLKYEDEARAIFEGFAQVLKADETLTAHLIVRLGWPTENDGEVETRAPEEPPDLDAAKLMEKWKADLRSKYDIGEHRLVVQFVPPQDESDTGELEAWVVPPGAAPPDPYAADDSEPEEEGEEPPEEGGSEDEPKGVASANAGGVRVVPRRVDFVRARYVTVF